MTIWDEIKVRSEGLKGTKNVTQSVEFILHYKEKFNNQQLKVEGKKEKGFVTKPGDYKKPQKKSEKWYQYKIRENKEVLCDNGIKIKWLDYEIPISFEKKGGQRRGRRKCVDLIGEMNNNIVLVELKWGRVKNNYKSDSPVYALFEVLHYAIKAFENRESLQAEEVYRKNFNYWEKIMKGFPNIVVAANKDYWNLWKKSYKNKKAWDEFKNMTSHIETKLPKEARINLFEFSNEKYTNWKNVI